MQQQKFAIEVNFEVNLQKVPEDIDAESRFRHLVTNAIPNYYNDSFLSKFEKLYGLEWDFRTESDSSDPFCYSAQKYFCKDYQFEISLHFIGEKFHELKQRYGENGQEDIYMDEPDYTEEQYEILDAYYNDELEDLSLLDFLKKTPEQVLAEQEEMTWVEITFSLNGEGFSTMDALFKRILEIIEQTEKELK